MGHPRWSLPLPPSVLPRRRGNEAGKQPLAAPAVQIIVSECVRDEPWAASTAPF